MRPGVSRVENQRPPEGGFGGLTLTFLRQDGSEQVLHVWHVRVGSDGSAQGVQGLVHFVLLVAEASHLIEAAIIAGLDGQGRLEMFLGFRQMVEFEFRATQEPKQIDVLLVLAENLLFSTSTKWPMNLKPL